MIDLPAGSPEVASRAAISSTDPSESAGIPLAREVLGRAPVRRRPPLLLSVLVLSLATAAPAGGVASAAGRRAAVQRNQNPAPQRGPASRGAGRARPQKPRMNRQEANHFLRSGAGKAKLKQYKREALDAPRTVTNHRAFELSQKTGTLREVRGIHRARARAIKVFTAITSVVSGFMGGVIGGAVGMFTGGMPSGPEMIEAGAHPAMHFISQGHFLVGAAVGVGMTVAAGWAAARGQGKAAKRIDRQAESEAEQRLLSELGVRD